MSPVRFTTHASPIGTLLLRGEGDVLTGLFMQDGPRPFPVDPRWEPDDAGFADARAQLDAYFAGDARRFELPLRLDGTPFQQRVWAALREIPYGETRSYLDLARHIGRPGAVRAVGLANGQNPVSVIVPCHRVIGSDGSLTGFGGGVERKRALLDLESGILTL